MTSVPVRSPQISSCSMAAARKVSAAHSSTLLPCARRLCASLPMVVVLPVPFTPTTRITSGSPSTLLTGFSAEVRMPRSSSFRTRFSSSTSPICLRSTFSRRLPAPAPWLPCRDRRPAAWLPGRRESRGRFPRGSRPTSSIRSIRFSRVRETACFMRSKNEGFSSVLPNKVWIIAIEHYTGRLQPCR